MWHLGKPRPIPIRNTGQVRHIFTFFVTFVHVIDLNYSLRGLFLLSSSLFAFFGWWLFLSFRLLINGEDVLAGTQHVVMGRHSGVDAWSYAHGIATRITWSYLTSWIFIRCTKLAQMYNILINIHTFCFFGILEKLLGVTSNLGSRPSLNMRFNFLPILSVKSQSYRRLNKIIRIWVFSLK